MRVFGYLLDSRVAGERITCGPLDAPAFFEGSTVGCLVLHGIGGTPANVRAVADRLHAEGYTVYAPLLAGHGTSVGDLAASNAHLWLNSAREGYQRLMDAGCTKIFAVGLSLGGLLSGVLATEKPLTGCVMICPPVVMQPFLRFSRWISPLFPYVRYETTKKRTPEPDGYYNMLSGMATRRLWDIEVLSRRFRRRIRLFTCPLLAIEAGKDNKVSKKTYRILRRDTVNVKDKRFLVFENSPHGCTYSFERDRVSAAVAAFIGDVVQKNHSIGL